MKHDNQFALDLARLTDQFAQQREILRWALGASIASIVGCDGERSVAGAGSAGAGGTGGTDAGVEACAPFPAEIPGPFPGDGTTAVNALTLTGIVRSDIRSSLAGATGVALGVPLKLKLTIKNSATCSRRDGFAVYLWHCDKDGNYSMYSVAAVAENYLRGVQETNAQGVVTFNTIFPGCYPGRWPHMHLEVYPNLAAATQGSNSILTSQLALPAESCRVAYTAAGYETSVTSLAAVALSTDISFSDGATLQLPTMSGNAQDGFEAALMVAL